MLEILYDPILMISERFLQACTKLFWVMGEIKGREILGSMQNKV